MIQWWIISLLYTEFIPTALCISWKVKLVGPFNRVEQRDNIIIDLNTGYQSIRIVLLQYFRYDVISHHTCPTMTWPTTIYLYTQHFPYNDMTDDKIFGLNLHQVSLEWFMPQWVKISDGKPSHTSNWGHHPCRAKLKWNHNKNMLDRK